MKYPKNLYNVQLLTACVSNKFNGNFTEGVDFQVTHFQCTVGSPNDGTRKRIRFSVVLNDGRNANFTVTMSEAWRQKLTVLVFIRLLFAQNPKCSIKLTDIVPYLRSTSLWPWRTALIAAWLTILASCAPDEPVVTAAILDTSIAFVCFTFIRSMTHVKNRLYYIVYTVRW